MGQYKKLSSGNPAINTQFTFYPKEVKKLSYYTDGLKQKNRYILSECITLLESRNVKKRSLSDRLIASLSENTYTSIRLGITGTPGVGKSTFIESLGLFLIEKGYRPAILAIDPSSHTSKGSILGDKTRMEKLSVHPDAFIRPTPSSGVLGGIALYTKESILLCEAAGFDFIIVETIGIGQSEVEVGNITDINLLLLQPGAGDDIQGIKRGIIESADIFVVNKADGPQLDLANRTKISYHNALQFFHHPEPGWDTPVFLCSSLENRGISEVFDAIMNYIRLIINKGSFLNHRKMQEINWFEKQSQLLIQSLVLLNPEIKKVYLILLNKLKEQKINSPLALRKMGKALSKLLITAS
ncbi:MAG: methylmalonyl Co-A mutase-associated GTPase MeaB [Saprospiraceae bacterium]|nr:methylmalonyl Co-A mutase-associated GTPase MeaB [Saprospiraceae bacterium]